MRKLHDYTRCNNLVLHGGPAPDLTLGCLSTVQSVAHKLDVSVSEADVDVCHTLPSVIRLHKLSGGAMMYIKEEISCFVEELNAVSYNALKGEFSQIFTLILIYQFYIWEIYITVYKRVRI